MVILRVCTIYFFSHLPLRDYAHHHSNGPFLSPSSQIPAVVPDSWLIAHAVKSPLHGPAPVYRHFVQCTAPRGLRAVKSALNPSFGRVKPPLCPGARGTGVSIDWCITKKKKSYEPRLVNPSKHDATSWLWLVKILWPRRERCCDRYITTAIRFIHLTVLNTFTKANQWNQNGRSQLWRSTRNSYPDSPCSRPKVYIWVSENLHNLSPNK